jgi:LPXTG-motif cell wall-anchored protein
VTVPWSVEAAAQPEQFRPLVEPWSDDFGVPEETTRVAPPQKQLASTGVDPNRGLVAGAVAVIAAGVVLVARRRPRN